MLDFITNLFSTDGFMPHGHCYQWAPVPFWLTVVSDVLIAVSYFSIPFALWYFARRRKDLEFRGLFHLFSAFILLCGLTHLLMAVGMWHPIYRVEGLAKLVTGIVSAATAVTLWRIVPQALRVPHPNELREARSRLVEEELAREKADLQNRMKSEFLAHMSHEIRSPLSGVTLPLEILKKEKLSAQNEELVAIASRSADRVNGLINDLLDLSKIESGKLKLKKEVFNNVDLIEECLGNLKPMASEKGLKLHSQVDETVPVLLYGDRLRTSQILTNLLHNALKYTDEGAVTLRSTIISHFGGKVRCCYTVQDSGVGISEENRQSIFESFEQAGNADEVTRGGTGLGLAIARKLAELMEGSLELKETGPEGSIFEACLEFEDPPKDSEVTLPQATAALDLSPTEHPLRVLLVEDMEANIIATCALLQKKGHHLDVCTSLAAGRKKLEAGKFDVVLLDLRLPDGSGLELVREIRENEGAKSEAERLPIVILSAQAMEEHRAAAMDAGVDEYLTKPISAQRLLDLIEHLHEKRGA